MPLTACSYPARLWAYAPPVISRTRSKKPRFVGVLTPQLTGTSWYPS